MRAFLAGLLLLFGAALGDALGVESRATKALPQLPLTVTVLERNLTLKSKESSPSEDLVAEFARTNEADFAYSVPGLGRFRVNAFRSRGSAGMVFRRVSVGRSRCRAPPASAGRDPWRDERRQTLVSTDHQQETPRRRACHRTSHDIKGHSRPEAAN